MKNLTIVTAKSLRCRMSTEIEEGLWVNSELMQYLWCCSRWVFGTYSLQPRMPEGGRWLLVYSNFKIVGRM